MPFKPPKSEKCTTCGKSVYAAERMEAGGNIYHKICFKCTVCKMTLKLNNYSQDSGNLYCKNHFQEYITAKNTQAAIVNWRSLSAQSSTKAYSRITANVLKCYRLKWKRIRFDWLLILFSRLSLYIIVIHRGFILLQCGLIDSCSANRGYINLFLENR